MNAIDLHRELDKLRRLVTTLQVECAKYVDRRAIALAVEPQRFNQSDVDIAKEEIARVEHHIANVHERIAALESHLPKPEELRIATSQARALSEQAEATRTEFFAAWTQLLMQTETAVEAARTVAHIAAEVRSASEGVKDLNARFALEVPVPDLPAPDLDEIEIVSAFSTRILSDVACHQILDDAVDTGLRAKLAERERRHRSEQEVAVQP